MIHKLREAIHKKLLHSKMEAQGCTTRQKHLLTNQHVSGAVGDYIPGPTK
jgi:hypothetical protein